MNYTWYVWGLMKCSRDVEQPLFLHAFSQASGTSEDLDEASRST